MALIRANIPTLLYEGIRQVLFEKYKETKPIYKEIFNIETSKKKSEKDVGFSGFGLLVEKPERERLATEDPLLGYETTYTHKAFGLVATVSKETQDDELYSVIKRIPNALATATVRTLETHAANVFNNGFTASGSFISGGDGKYLFATDHPLTGGGTQSNKLSTPANLSVTSLEEALYIMRRTKGDKGESLATVSKWLLFPPELSRVASELLGSPTKPDTADRAKNWLADQGLKAVVNTGWVYLDDPNAWFVLADKNEHNLWFFMRTELETEREGDFWTKDFNFSVFTRFSVGWSDWRGVFGSEGA